MRLSIEPSGQCDPRKASFDEVVGQNGLAFLRESHGGYNMPPACCQEPPFEPFCSSNQQLRPLRPVPLFDFLEVVGQNGLEPSTSRLSVVCSSQLSYWPISTSHFLGTSTPVPSKLNNVILTHLVLTLGYYRRNLVSPEVSLERR